VPVAPSVGVHIAPDQSGLRPDCDYDHLAFLDLVCNHADETRRGSRGRDVPLGLSMPQSQFGGLPNFSRRLRTSSPSLHPNRSSSASIPPPRRADDGEPVTNAERAAVLLEPLETAGRIELGAHKGIDAGVSQEVHILTTEAEAIWSGLH